MSNNKKTIPKKVLVRNTDQKVRKTVFVSPEVVEILPVVHQITNADRKSNRTRYSESRKFAAPEFNTTLRVYADIKKTQALLPRRVKSVNDLKETERKIIEDKAVKKVNFPPTEPIYKDLIALEISPAEIVQRTSRSTAHNREVWTKKDIEPHLHNFRKQIRRAEYRVIVDNYLIDEPPIRKFNGLTLHRIMESWKCDSEYFSKR